MTKNTTQVGIDTERHLGTPRSVDAALRAGRETGGALVGAAVSQGGLTRNPVYVPCDQALNPDVRAKAIEAARGIGDGAKFERVDGAPSVQQQCGLPQGQQAQNNSPRR